MTAKTTEQLVSDLLDREAIRDLPKRYCHCVWQNDLEGIVSLFTADGSFTVKGRRSERTIKGREELRKMYQQSVADLTPLPYVHNHVVELKGNGRAIGTCYVELREKSGAMNWIGTGYYDDQYLKVGEEWKFASRRMTAYFAHRPKEKQAG